LIATIRVWSGCATSANIVSTIPKKMRKFLKIYFKKLNTLSFKRVLFMRSVVHRHTTVLKPTHQQAFCTCVDAVHPL
jgi:hypothetical protein